MQTRARAFAAFAPPSTGNGPNLADCLEIRTCLLALAAPRACGAVRNVADCKGAVADCKPNMAVAPKPCGTVQIAADCKGAVADCKLNMAKFGPGTADRMCHSPIGNCQVLCAASAHTGGRGGVAYLL